MSHPPFSSTEEFPITVESVANAGPQTQSIDTRTVSGDYFNTLQIPLLSGQFFSVDDAQQSTPVVIVNQAMVNRYWSNQDPIGKRIKIGTADSKGNWFSVKGVVKDSAQVTLDRETRPEIYFALGLSPYERRCTHECRSEEYGACNSGGDSRGGQGSAGLSDSNNR
jgi:hypothetical protein